MERPLDTWMSPDNVEERLIGDIAGLAEDMVEITKGLVVVYD